MKAPAIYVVRGLNQTTELIAWYFDRNDAAAHCERLNAECLDDFGYEVDWCSSGSEDVL